MWQNPIDGSYTQYQLDRLVKTTELISKDGLIIEIGAWKGRSTATIANTIYPKMLHVVDTWQGNIDEQKVTGKSHSTVKEASNKDIFKLFEENMKKHTKCNYISYKMDCFDYLNGLKDKITFCHIDASHDYKSVKKTIEILLPLVVNGGILCGDDIASANKNRLDLQGGVERAVMELLPGYERDRNFWWHIKK